MYARGPNGVMRGNPLYDACGPDDDARVLEWEANSPRPSRETRQLRRDVSCVRRGVLGTSIAFCVIVIAIASLLGYDTVRLSVSREDITRLKRVTRTFDHADGQEDGPVTIPHVQGERMRVDRMQVGELLDVGAGRLTFGDAGGISSAGEDGPLHVFGGHCDGATGRFVGGPLVLGGEPDCASANANADVGGNATPFADADGRNTDQPGHHVVLHGAGHRDIQLGVGNRVMFGPAEPDLQRTMLELFHANHSVRLPGAKVQLGTSAELNSTEDVLRLSHNGEDVLAFGRHGQARLASDTLFVPNRFALSVDSGPFNVTVATLSPSALRLDADLELDEARAVRTARIEEAKQGAGVSVAGVHFSDGTVTGASGLTVGDISFVGNTISNKNDGAALDFGDSAITVTGALNGGSVNVDQIQVQNTDGPNLEIAGTRIEYGDSSIQFIHPTEATGGDVSNSMVLTSASGFVTVESIVFSGNEMSVENSDSRISLALAQDIVQVTGGLNVDGAVDITDGLTVSGAVDLTDGLTVSGTDITLTVEGNAVFEGNVEYRSQVTHVTTITEQRTMSVRVIEGEETAPEEGTASADLFIDASDVLSTHTGSKRRVVIGGRPLVVDDADRITAGNMEELAVQLKPDQTNALTIRKAGLQTNPYYENQPDIIRIDSDTEKVHVGWTMEAALGKFTNVTLLNRDSGENSRKFELTPTSMSFDHVQDSAFNFSYRDNKIATIDTNTRKFVFEKADVKAGRVNVHQIELTAEGSNEPSLDMIMVNGQTDAKGVRIVIKQSGSSTLPALAFKDDHNQKLLWFDMAASYTQPSNGAKNRVVISNADIKEELSISQGTDQLMFTPTTITTPSSFGIGSSSDNDAIIFNNDKTTIKELQALKGTFNTGGNKPVQIEDGSVTVGSSTDYIKITKDAIGVGETPLTLGVIQYDGEMSTILRVQDEKVVVGQKVNGNQKNLEVNGNLFLDTGGMYLNDKQVTSSADELNLLDIVTDDGLLPSELGKPHKSKVVTTDQYGTTLFQNFGFGVDESDTEAIHTLLPQNGYNPTNCGNGGFTSSENAKTGWCLVTSYSGWGSDHPVSPTPPAERTNQTMITLKGNLVEGTSNGESVHLALHAYGSKAGQFKYFVHAGYGSEANGYYTYVLHYQFFDANKSSTWYEVTLSKYGGSALFIHTGNGWNLVSFKDGP